MRRTFIAAILLSQIASASISAQQSIRFEPKTYSNAFSSQPAPVLQLHPCDTVHTTSVDAGGWDQHGVRVAKRGNPLTGPFFVEGAEPGDVLAVTLLQVSLNRDYATTLNALFPKAVPLHPFLGCVGVAPEGDKGMGSGASGAIGGNLDFRHNTAGATIYLPVFHSGALLYLGDGHAAQGDGELNGEHLMFFAIEPSLDKSLKVATDAMRTWLQTRYQLTMKEVSQVIGPVIEYRIPKVAASKVEIVALIPKKTLEQLVQVFSISPPYRSLR